MTRVDPRPAGMLVDRRPLADATMRDRAAARTDEGAGDARRRGRRDHGPEPAGRPPPSPTSGDRPSGDREFDGRMNAQAARLAAVYEAEALTSLIYQMGGAPRPSAKGTYVDVRV